jgi:hypothetical protein
MAPAAQKCVTLADLVCTPSKAELIGGQGLLRSRRQVTGQASLIFGSRGASTTTPRRPAEASPTPMGWGSPCRNFPPGVNRSRPIPHIYVGPLPEDPMRFIQGPPTLAVEGPQRERL